MEKKPGMCDKLACKVVAMAFIIIGLGMMVLGVTFLPGIGLLIALPIMWLSICFLYPEEDLSESHEEAAEKASAIVYEEREYWCPWPPIPSCPQE
jgi:hypothetical protein